jgi:hypothetical protein
VPCPLVLDDFGHSGRAYRETAEEAADFKTVVDDLRRWLLLARSYELTGQLTYFSGETKREANNRSSGTAPLKPTDRSQVNYGVIGEIRSQVTNQ